MAGQTIFGDIRFLDTRGIARISVIQEGNHRYFAFLTRYKHTSLTCEENARKEGRKVLYRINIIPKKKP